MDANIGIVMVMSKSPDWGPFQQPILGCENGWQQPDNMLSLPSLRFAAPAPVRGQMGVGGASAGGPHLVGRGVGLENPWEADLSSGHWVDLVDSQVLCWLE